MIDSPRYFIEGGGKWAGIHASVFEHFTGQKPDAVSTTNKALRQRWEAMGVTVHGRDEIPSHLEHGDIDCDFGVISVLPEATFQATRNIIEASQGQLKALLVEKPLAQMTQDATALIRLAARKDIQLVMTGQTRFSPLWQKLMNNLNLENTKTITIRRAFPYRRAENGAPGVEKYGSVFWNLLPHVITELEHTLSRKGISLHEVQVESVHASSRNSAHQKKGITDTAYIHLRVPKTGTRIHIEVSQAAPEGEEKNDTRVETTKGHAFVFTENGRIKNLSEDEEIVRSVEGENTVQIQDADFLFANDLVGDPDLDFGVLDREREHDRIFEITRLLKRIEMLAR